MTPQQYGPLIGIGIALVLILMRNRRPRTLNVKWMWVVPVLIVAMISFGLWGMAQAPGMSHTAFGPGAWAILMVGLLLGGAAGWWRGKTVTIEKAADGTLKAQASPLGLILIVALLVSRSALRPWLEANAVGWHLNVLAVQDAFLLFAMGLVVMQRVEMWIRARHILAGEPDSHTAVTDGGAGASPT